MDKTISIYSKGFKRLVKVVAIVTVSCFILQDVSMATGGMKPNWSSATPQGNAAAQPNQVNAIDIPYDLGIKRSTQQHNSDEVIINVQDAHSSIDAQKQIAKLFQSFVAKYDLKLIGVEGTVGAIDTSIVSALPLEDVREQVANSLLNQTKINASEFFRIVSNADVELFGIEDAALYASNIDSYSNLLNAQPKIQKELLGLHELVSEYQKHIFNAETMDFNAKRIAYRDGDLEFIDYWSILEKLIQKTEVNVANRPNLKKLIQTAELEKEIIFEAANTQRDHLVDELKTKLDEDSINTLVDAAVQFKLGKTTPGSFHAYIIQLAGEQNINPTTYKDLILYTRYASVYESIDLIDVIDEIESIEDEIRSRLFSTEEERGLDSFLRTINILTKFLEAKMSASDEAYYRKNKADFEFDYIRKYLQSQKDKYAVEFKSQVNLDYLETQMPSADEFYTDVKARNATMLNNLVKRMREKGTKVAAMVSGGFHAEGLSELMNQNRISHVVVMPKFDADAGERAYATIITQKGSYIDASVRRDAQRETLAMVLAASMKSGLRFDAAKDLYIQSYIKTMEAKGVEIKPEWLSDASIEEARSNAIGGYTYDIRFNKDNSMDIDSKKLSLKQIDRIYALGQIGRFQVHQMESMKILGDLQSTLEAKRFDFDFMINQSKERFIGQVQKQFNSDMLIEQWNKDWLKTYVSTLRKKGIQSIDELDFKDQTELNTLIDVATAEIELAVDARVQALTKETLGFKQKQAERMSYETVASGSGIKGMSPKWIITSALLAMFVGGANNRLRARARKAKLSLYDFNLGFEQGLITPDLVVQNKSTARIVEFKSTPKITPEVDVPAIVSAVEKTPTARTRLDEGTQDTVTEPNVRELAASTTATSRMADDSKKEQSFVRRLFQTLKSFIAPILKFFKEKLGLSLLGIAVVGGLAIAGAPLLAVIVLAAFALYALVGFVSKNIRSRSTGMGAGGTLILSLALSGMGLGGSEEIVPPATEVREENEELPIFAVAALNQNDQGLDADDQEQYKLLLARIEILQTELNTLDQRVRGSMQNNPNQDYRILSDYKNFKSTQISLANAKREAADLWIAQNANQLNNLETKSQNIAVRKAIKDYKYARIRADMARATQDNVIGAYQGMSESNLPWTLYRADGNVFEFTALNQIPSFALERDLWSKNRQETFEFNPSRFLTGGLNTHIEDIEFESALAAIKTINPEGVEDRLYIKIMRSIDSGAQNQILKPLLKQFFEGQYIPNIGYVTPIEPLGTYAYSIRDESGDIVQNPNGTYQLFADQAQYALPDEYSDARQQLIESKSPSIRLSNGHYLWRQVAALAFDETGEVQHVFESIEDLDKTDPDINILRRRSISRERYEYYRDNRDKILDYNKANGIRNFPWTAFVENVDGEYFIWDQELASIFESDIGHFEIISDTGFFVWHPNPKKRSELFINPSIRVPGFMIEPSRSGDGGIGVNPNKPGLSERLSRYNLNRAATDGGIIEAREDRYGYTTEGLAVFSGIPAVRRGLKRWETHMSAIALELDNSPPGDMRREYSLRANKLNSIHLRIVEKERVSGFRRAIEQTLTELASIEEKLGLDFNIEQYRFSDDTSAIAMIMDVMRQELKTPDEVLALIQNKLITEPTASKRETIFTQIRELLVQQKELNSDMQIATELFAEVLFLKSLKYSIQVDRSVVLDTELLVIPGERVARDNLGDVLNQVLKNTLPDSIRLEVFRQLPGVLNSTLDSKTTSLGAGPGIMRIAGVTLLSPSLFMGDMPQANSAAIVGGEALYLETNVATDTKGRELTKSFLVLDQKRFLENIKATNNNPEELPHEAPIMLNLMNIYDIGISTIGRIQNDDDTHAFDALTILKSRKWNEFPLTDKDNPNSLLFRGIPASGQHLNEDPITGRQMPWGLYEQRVGEIVWASLSQVHAAAKLHELNRTEEAQAALEESAGLIDQVLKLQVNAPDELGHGGLRAAPASPMGGPRQELVYNSNLASVEWSLGYVQALLELSNSPSYKDTPIGQQALKDAKTLYRAVQM
ncbi:MAG: hypothetical protein ACI9Y8_001696, partial [Candidatus Omnitrophota bacterium]